mmetsp:Transcript_20318/g.46583  ORF Transcript_20318/g.46583 Transcript_20318/m.46583 type:complete len:110 (+) Transcript_20318:1377-1706(+)
MLPYYVIRIVQMLMSGGRRGCISDTNDDEQEASDASQMRSSGGRRRVPRSHFVLCSGPRKFCSILSPDERPRSTRDRGGRVLLGFSRKTIQRGMDGPPIDDARPFAPQQ